MNQLREQLKLYVVTDERQDMASLLSNVRNAVAGGATVIQLRRKNEDGGRFVEIGRAIRKITKDHGALYIVNDRVDVAVLTEADGVHVGQSDISCRDARRLIGDGIVGVSVRNVEEAVQAVEDGADYVGVGAIYPTNSKDDAEVCGLAALSAISRQTEIPIVAIGGITRERVSEVVRCGAHGVAVVSAVMGAENPEQAARELIRRIVK